MQAAACSTAGPKQGTQAERPDACPTTTSYDVCDRRRGTRRHGKTSRHPLAVGCWLRMTRGRDDEASPHSGLARNATNADARRTCSVTGIIIRLLSLSLSHSHMKAPPAQCIRLERGVRLP
eukprot:scaffold94_cov117-Isochrysis_galbana.AAC.1